MAVKETLVLDVKSTGKEEFWTYDVRKATADSERTIHNTGLFRTNHLMIVERTDEETFAEWSLKKAPASGSVGDGISSGLPDDPLSVTEIVIDTMPADKIEISSEVQFSLDSGEFNVSPNSPDRIFGIRLTIQRPLGSIMLYLASQIS